MARLMWEVARRSFRRASHYRAATASGVFVNTVFGYIRASVLLVVADVNGGEVRGLTGSDLVTFAFASQAFIMIVGAFRGTDLAERIRSGDVVVDLYRPVDVQLWWLASWYGNAGFQVLARGIPPLLLGALAFDVRWPDPWWHWLPFVAATVLATTAGFAVRFMVDLTTFWVLDNRGIDQMATVMISFFAGLLLPITLFPPWLEALSRLLPFASMIQLPVEIFLGLHDGPGIAWVLAQQVAWVLALLAAGRVMLAAVTRKVVIQGG